MTKERHLWFLMQKLGEFQTFYYQTQKTIMHDKISKLKKEFTENLDSHDLLLKQIRDLGYSKHKLPISKYKKFESILKAVPVLQIEGEKLVIPES